MPEDRQTKPSYENLDEREFLAKNLEFRPSYRYQNFSEFVSDLEEILQKKEAPDRFKKRGEREIDLAVKGWVFATNCPNDPSKIKDAIKFAEAMDGLDIHIENQAYDQFGQEEKGAKAVYVLRPRSKPSLGSTYRVPEELVREAKTFHRFKKRKRALQFLLGVYKQIAKGANGTYTERLEERSGYIIPVLYYFADKLRGLGKTKEAERIEKKVQESGKFENIKVGDGIPHVYKVEGGYDVHYLFRRGYEQGHYRIHVRDGKIVHEVALEPNGMYRMVSPRILKGAEIRKGLQQLPLKDARELTDILFGESNFLRDIFIS